MRVQLVVDVLVEARDARIFDRAVHPLGPRVHSRVFGRGRPVRSPSRKSSSNPSRTHVSASQIKSKRMEPKWMLLGFRGGPAI